MNKTLEKIWWAGTALAAIGIITFWIAGVNDFDNLASWSIIGAGLCAWVALISEGLRRLRLHNGFEC